MARASLPWLERVPTPSYVIDLARLRQNLAILKDIEETTGAHVLLAQKCFSMYSLYPLIGAYLSGTTASGLYEARLGREEMGKENHVFSPAYRAENMAELVTITDHIVFNSLSQWRRFGAQVQAAGVSCGRGINQDSSTQ